MMQIRQDMLHLFEKFDKHDNNAELTRNISKALEAAPVPKAAPVK